MRGSDMTRRGLLGELLGGLLATSSMAGAQAFRPGRAVGFRSGFSFLSTPTLAPKLVALGDSITATSAGYSNAYATNRPGLAYQAVAQGGRSIGTSSSLNDGGNTLWGNLQVAIDTAGSVYTILIGANDLSSDTSGWVTKLANFISALRAGRPGIKVGVATLLPRTDAGGAGFNGWRGAVNPQIRGLTGIGADFCIPFGDNWMMTDTAPDEGVYWDSGDRLHPNSTGQATMRDIYAAVIDPIFAGATATSPTFSYTAENNVPVSRQRIGRSSYLTGMAMANVVGATVSGAGDFARGQNAFGTASQTAINGDVFSVRQTSAAANSTAVSTTVTAGAQSATYTLTTVVGVPLAWTSAPATLTATSASVTHSAVPMTAGRQVLFINRSSNSATNGEPASVTIDGVAATKINTAAVYGSSGGLSVWISGQVLAAGNYNVVLSGGVVGFQSIVYGAISGGAISSMSWAGLAPAARNQATNYPATLGTPAQTVGSGGIMLIFAHNGTGPSVSFANATADRTFTAQPGATGSANGSDLRSFTSTTSMTPTAVWSAFANTSGFVAVSFGQ